MTFPRLRPYNSARRNSFAGQFHGVLLLHPMTKDADTASRLPEYSLRFSRRAGRVLLRAVPGIGLEVVIPEALAPKLAQSFVPDLLRRHEGWIGKALARLEARQAGRMAEIRLPDRLELNGGRECVFLLRAGEGEETTARARGPLPASLRECPVPDFLWREGAAHEPGRALAARMRPEAVAAPRALLLCGSDAECAALLREWTRREAAERFGPRLEALSARHDLAFSRLSFRFQKSRWGSRSARGTISLNACLLFLPEELADYVLLHELCHTRHMNHSERFWRLVFSLDAQALRKDRALRGAWRYVPGFLRS